MSFNKRYLPSLDTLKEIREKCDNEKEFLNIILGKSDLFSGPNDSVSYIESIIQNLKENKQNGLGS
jgi:hypothetical protein